MKEEGFTLIELMIVIAIVSILAILTITNMSFLDETVLNQEVNKLHAACRHAQHVALLTNREQIMTFELASNTYRFNGRKETLPKNVCFGFKDEAKGPPSAPHTKIANPITFKNNAISFAPSGIIAAGTIYLTDKNKKNMFALSVPVSQVSYLRKYRYDKKWGIVQ